MAENRELYERVAFDLAKFIVEKTQIQGKKITKDEILQTYLDSHHVITSQEMPSKES